MYHKDLIIPIGLQFLQKVGYILHLKRKTDYVLLFAYQTEGKSHKSPLASVATSYALVLLAYPA